jgi:hypothetical protein
MKVSAPIFITAVLAFSAGAQNQQPATWAYVTYLKVPTDKIQQYEDAAGMYRKVMEGRIAAGEVNRFIVTRMIVPFGSDAKYNYISLTIRTGVPVLDRSPADVEKDWTSAGLKRATWVDRMNTLGVVVVKRELWRNVERLGGVETGDFVRFDTKKVSKPGDYVNAERTYHKAYWAERMKQGALKGWALNYVALPGGEDRPYSFVTMQWFKDEGQMYGIPAVSPRESWKVAAPGRDPWQINRDTLAVSHTATVELGRVRLALGTPPAPPSGSN